MKTLCAAALLVGAGCIKAPDIILVDHATALEQQAAGSYARLESQLATAGLAARPTPLSREQLDAAGIDHPPLVDDVEETEADRIDVLLKEKCLGEALDGTLVETADRCGLPDQEGVPALVERANRNRVQLWQSLQALRPKASTAEVRRAWRQLHLQAVVCGGQVQRADGKWEPKAC
jgi:hypothetical protein